MNLVIEATEQALRREFAEAVEQHRQFHRSMAWVIGDKALALQEYKRAKLREEADELRERAANCTDDHDGAEARKELLTRADKILSDKTLSAYTDELCKWAKIDEGYVRNCVMLARFYPLSCRHDGLGSEHHVVAMQAARKKIGGGVSRGGAVDEQGVVIASGWLSRASQEGLSVSTLRKVVNISLATGTPARGKPEADPFAVLNAADQWAITYRAKVSSLSDSDCVRLYALMQGLRELAEELERRVGGGSGARKCKNVG